MHETLAHNADIAVVFSDQTLIEEKRNKILQTSLFRSV